MIKLRPHLFTSTGGDKNILKNNVGVFLNTICHSNILTSLYKITDIYHDVFDSHPSWFFHYPSLTSDGCLLSYLRMVDIIKDILMQQQLQCVLGFMKNQENLLVVS